MRFFITKLQLNAIKFFGSIIVRVKSTNVKEVVVLRISHNAVLSIAWYKGMSDSSNLLYVINVNLIL